MNFLFFGFSYSQFPFTPFKHDMTPRRPSSYDSSDSER
jgi:hypothetical protein